MPSGARTHDADAVGVDVPFGGATPHNPNGAAGVLKHDRVTVPGGTEPVFDDKGGDAVFGKPFGVPGTFVCGQAAIPASRKDNDGGAGRERGIGQEGCDCGFVTFPDAERVGGAIGPKGQGGLRGGEGASGQSHGK